MPVEIRSTPSIRARIEETHRSGSQAAIVEELLPLLEGPTPDRVILAAIHSLGSTDPIAAERAIAGTTEYVLRRLDEPDPAYHESGVETVLALVRDQPRESEHAADLFTERVAWRFTDRQLTRTLAHVAPEAPAFVFESAEYIATLDDHAIERKWTLDWAFVRAARADPAAAEAFVDSLGERVRANDSNASAAIETLGLLGRSIPNSVAPAVPILVDRLEDSEGESDGRHRAAVAEALGLISGRYRSWDVKAGIAAPALVADAVPRLATLVLTDDVANDADGTVRAGHDERPPEQIAAAIETASNSTTDSQPEPDDLSEPSDERTLPSQQDVVGGDRRSHHVESVRLFCDLVTKGYQTLVFTAARQGTEPVAFRVDKATEKTTPARTG